MSLEVGLTNPSLDTTDSRVYFPYRVPEFQNILASPQRPYTKPIEVIRGLKAG
jgi:hypothetical protein